MSFGYIISVNQLVSCMNALYGRIFVNVSGLVRGRGIALSLIISECEKEWLKGEFLGVRNPNPWARSPCIDRSTFISWRNEKEAGNEDSK